MTSPQDVFNPEVMDPGNSGAKLNLALSPNQVIQDNTVKNCAEGLKDAIWLIWRTLVAYGDDYGVKKLAQEFHPEKKPIFIDYESFDDMNFNERKTIHIDLALGMKSEENSLQRMQIIKQTQTGMAQEIAAAATTGALTPSLLKKLKKPYADTLYILGIKDCDTYLPTDEEVMEMVQQAQKAASSKQPSAEDQQKMASAQLDQVRAQQINAEIAGNTASQQLDAYSLIKEHKAQHYGQ